MAAPATPPATAPIAAPLAPLPPARLLPIMPPKRAPAAAPPTAPCVVLGPLPAQPAPKETARRDRMSLALVVISALDGQGYFKFRPPVQTARLQRESEASSMPLAVNHPCRVSLCDRKFPQLGRWPHLRPASLPWDLFLSPS